MERDGAENHVPDAGTVTSSERHAGLPGAAPESTGEDSLANRIDRARSVDRREREATVSKVAKDRRMVLGRAGGFDFAVAIDALVELVATQDLQIVHLPHLPSPFRGVARRRGRLVPIADLGRLLGKGAAGGGSQARLMVCRRRDALAGLLVDEITEIRPVTEDEFRALPSGERSVAPSNDVLSGMLEIDGRLHGLLDVNRVWSSLRNLVPLRKGGESWQNG